MIITLVVLVTELVIEGAEIVRRDHKIWLTNANTVRNNIGQLFTLPQLT